MNPKVKTALSLMLSIVLCVLFGGALMLYAKPMEDVSLDFSLSLEDGAAPEQFDSKGWTVYTQNGETVTELVSNGFGAYSGFELGQTIYFSRMMAEELDSPTLQIMPVDRTFSVWLDGTLIYSDCPELDNRIGYLTLPMNEWDRLDPITISLPMDYQGKTLTIAQSTPEYSETASVSAVPADVMLYCGYAYESGLISESFQTAILTAAAFVVGVLLLIAFVLHQDLGLLCLSLVAFLWMVTPLTNASFFWEYFGSFDNSLLPVTKLLSLGALLVFLVSRGGTRRNLLLGVIAAYGLSVIADTVTLYIYPSFATDNWAASILAARLPYWLGFAALAVALVLGFLFWRKENRFYRIFPPLALAAAAVYWLGIVLVNGPGQVGEQIIINLQSGHITYILFRTTPPVMAAAVVTAIVEAIRTEVSRRTEKRLLEARRELALESYEAMRRQHEEIMMLRHDMTKHFQVLRGMSGEAQITGYLDELIGQNEKIRPVVQSGNKMLDIILNGKLSAAIDAGVTVKIVKAEAPETLPLSDTDLCSLVMNIMDNAVNAAVSASSAGSFIRLNIHVKNNFLVIACENSINNTKPKSGHKKETVPKHGLGLMIIRGITERYEGIFDTEYGSDHYQIRIAIPLL